MNGFSPAVWHAELDQMRADQNLYAINAANYLLDDSLAQALTAAQQVRSIQQLIEEHMVLYEELRTRELRAK
jgi:hypothetical protein